MKSDVGVGMTLFSSKAPEALFGESHAVYMLFSGKAYVLEVQSCRNYSSCRFTFANLNQVKR